MRWKAKEKDVWYDWFAWRPVRMSVTLYYLTTKTGGGFYYKKIFWAWLEKIQRKKDISGDCTYREKVK